MKHVVWLIVLIFILGCQTTGPMKSETETNEDVKEAVVSVAEAVSGKDLSEEDKKNLVEQIRSDAEAQSAIQSITDSISQTKQRVKYSPATGKRYAPHMTVDPETGTPLEWLE